MSWPQIPLVASKRLGWAITVLQLIAIVGFVKANAKVSEYVAPKSVVGDFEAAKPYEDIASTFFIIWFCLVVFAVLLGIFSRQPARDVIFLFPVLILPTAEFFYAFFAAFK